MAFAINQDRFTRAELRELYNKALGYVRDNYIEKQTITQLYRNKPSDYFDTIKRQEGNIMKPYLKDQNGDPRCPINGRINGLFFSGSLPIPPQSPFGDRRLLLPADKIINRNMRFYFADFYCKKPRIHYVTIVVTRPNSSADIFCQANLMQLDISPGHQNELLSLDIFGTIQMAMKPGSVYGKVGGQLYVEIFYTEDVDLTQVIREGGRIELSGTMGIGRSNGVGFIKNQLCPVCNLRRGYTANPFGWLSL